MIRNLFIATAFVAVTCLSAAPVSAQFGEGNSANNLFSQYVTPDGPNMTTAGMYPAPHYSPMLGAQSYYTYQPLMPHEMMYQHSRNYYNYYNTGGYYGAPNSLNKTSVRWQSGTNHMGPLRGSTGRSDRYRIHNRLYDINSGRGNCANGNCESAYSADIYDGGCSDGGCANGCSANLSDGSQRR